MTTLTKNQKKEIDRVVMLAIERLYVRRFELNTIYWDKPNKFSKILIQKMHQVPALIIDQSVLSGVRVDQDEAIRLADKSIRRLRNRKKLRQQYITVPVISTKTNKMSKRKIACYWPSTVLDALANI